MGVLDRVRKAWNAFRYIDSINPVVDYSLGATSFGPRPPHKPRFLYFSDRSLISAILTRISIDVASVGIRHIKVDDLDRYEEDAQSYLNYALVFEPNRDQSPRSFRQDLAMTLFEKGVAAVVPVDTTVSPVVSDRYDVHTMRVGEIIAWYPHHVRVSVYNENSGKREEIILEKKFVAIVENPLYQVMNEPNGTLQRLIRKLNLLDTSDEQVASGKLDLIIQLPYVIKSEARRQQAEQRREDIEFQLKGSQYGIAYTDGTEKITQLNRPAENNLLKQVEYLTAMLYGQLGITEEVMNGTATEQTMINYYDRTIEPILDSIVEAMHIAFLGYVGTKGNERIRYFRDPFRLVPVNDIAEIADKFTRNEILTANEIRGFMGIAPSSDPKADQLINSNMPQPDVMMPELPEGIDFESGMPAGFDPLELRKEVQNGSRF